MHRFRTGAARTSAVPLRRSLLIRLLAVSALVSVCSITATAWAVVKTTAVVLSRERGQALADDARIYDTLLGYAATHPSWSGIRPTVDRLAQSTGHRIVLLGRDGHPWADSAAGRHGPFQPPQKATAVIDPLAVDPELSKDTDDGSGTQRIDSRAVGPFQLPEEDSERLKIIANRVVLCLRDRGDVQAHVQMTPGGRPKVVVAGPGGTLALGNSGCVTTVLTDPTPPEAKALASLTALVNACLARRHADAVTVHLDGSWEPQTRHALPSSTVSSCLTTSRSQQLAPYVAPAALMYVSSPGRTATTFFDVSPANRLRIAGWAAAVLVLTVTVTTLAGIRLVKPLRTLTTAAMHMEAGEVSTRVPVRGGDEIARLSAAFNAMSERREQLESARRDMTNDIAHELRTPVSNIRGWLEAVEDGLARADPGLVTSLLGQALQLQHIIDDLRDLSAAEAGELRLALEPVHVTELLSAIVMANQATATAACVTVSVTDNGPVPVMADPVRLRQMIGNLVSNAIRHTPAGGSVVLSSRVEYETVVIDVADTGSGLSADELPHVFDRFWRAEKSRSRQSGGSGLGLAIVRRLAEAHKGTISAVSVPNVGSTFTLRLPRHGRGN
ncbi:sensor histidine kinase [Streptomyces coffeae]|uniref:histidine kinase n=1 Tax=Streptomyces coffeae TaxID=621382 RepID=A0ABS1NJI7_9ACTN|nr:HAMP domain-containing sensor histidine kinase [Streptomyces coffeae]MBL1100201.1 HAMP domain-containing histidine kinase [Streptomyces coffeae]